MSADASMLADVPLFALMDGQERFTLAGLLEIRRFLAGSQLFHAGDAGDCLYIIRSGRVRVYLKDNFGDAIELGEVGPGEILGEITLLDAGPRTATAEALEDIVALEVDRDDLLEVITRHPHAALDLLTVMGRRLRGASEMLRTRTARNLNVIEEERQTLGQRVADRVASFGGSWTFILCFAAVLVTWMGINIFILEERSRFDPYPFILLNLVLSTLAAIQAPVIMMSQNRQVAKDRLQADLDYEVNQRAEREVSQLHEKIDRLYETVQAHQAAIDRERRRGGPMPLGGA